MTCLMYRFNLKLIYILVTEQVEIRVRYKYIVDYYKLHRTRTEYVFID